MRWHLIGPAFVNQPRDSNYERVSSQNTSGAQCEVDSIAVAESDADVVYIVCRPQSGGAAVFRSDDGGLSWTDISHTLIQADFTSSPTCVAVAWDDAQFVVVGDVNGLVHVSRDGGQTWPVSGPTSGMVNIVLVDPPRMGNQPPTIYAGTQSGLYRSTTGGMSFDPILPGAICDLAADYADSGDGNYFAAVASTGVYHATDPSQVATRMHPGGWELLSTRLDGGPGPGMLPSAMTPAPATRGAYFDQIRLATSHRVPGRAYAWFAYIPDNANPAQPLTRALYVCGDPRSSWSMVPMVSPPQIYSGYYCFRFAAVPAVEGDTGPDVLFMCAGAVNRSIDGGRTWSAADPIHTDYHAVAVHPRRVRAGERVTTWFGCDGGAGRDLHAADPEVAFQTASYWDQRAAINNEALSVRTRYYPALAVTDLATVRGAPALAYTMALDTGMACYEGGDTWRYVCGTDSIYVAPIVGSSGVAYWKHQGSMSGWPNFNLQFMTDDGSFGSGELARPVTLHGSNGEISTTSNVVTGADGLCYCGGQIRDVTATLQTDVAAVGTATVTPSSMAFISVGSSIVLPNESVDVTAVTDTSFTASFGKTHGVGTMFTVEREVMLRADLDGIATIIGQELRDNGRNVAFVAAHPTDRDVIYAYTSPGRGDQAHQVIRTTAASAASVATVWDVVSGGQPATAGEIGSIAIDPSGRAFVLLQVTPPGGPATPLFEVSSGTWLPILGIGEPSTPASARFGRLVIDPADPTTLYAAFGGSVYRVAVHGSTCTWTDLSDGLPGLRLTNIEAVDVGTTARPHTVLRACAAASAAFERDADGTTDMAPHPYLRAHVRDVGYLTPREEGQPNPFVPTALTWHFQSPDVKLDTLARAPDGTTPWFQNDPEFSTLPIDSVTFGQLKDHSQQLPPGASALLHVQVHNRSDLPARNVKVWALVAPAAAGLPSLARSASAGDHFDFWAQFDASTGDIVAGLPADSPWRALGAPLTIPTITADHARVATWNWTAPSSGDQPLHYCVAVFVHSAAAPLIETSLDIDEIALHQTQVAQKNLHIMPTLIGGGG